MSLGFDMTTSKNLDLYPNNENNILQDYWVHSMAANAQKEEQRNEC